VDVIEVNQTIVRLRAPSNGRLWTKACGSPAQTRPTSRLAGTGLRAVRPNIYNAPAAVIVAHVHHVVIDPHVVRTSFRHRVLRNFVRVLMSETSTTCTMPRTGYASGRGYQISAETLRRPRTRNSCNERRVSTCQPAIAVQLMMIKT